jgi:hypothetical protein
VLKTSQNEMRDVTLAQLEVHVRVLKTTASKSVNIDPSRQSCYSLHIPVLTCNNIAITNHRSQTLENCSSETFGETCKLFIAAFNFVKCFQPA